MAEAFSKPRIRRSRDHDQLSHPWMISVLDEATGQYYVCQWRRTWSEALAWCKYYCREAGWRCPSCGKLFDQLPEHHAFTYGDDQSQAICFNVPLEQP